MTPTLAQVSQDALRTKILHTFEAAKHAWEIPLHIGPVDISINKSIWFLWIGAAVTFLIPVSYTHLTLPTTPYV